MWFWRPAALSVGLIFFVRWVVQILDFMKSSRSTRSGNNLEQRNGIYGIHNVHEKKPLVDLKTEKNDTDYSSTMA